MTARAMGSDVWGRKVARLPTEGVLLVCTDLHGNRRDYEAMKRIYAREEASGNDPVLAFCGDLVHGPSPDLLRPGAWPDYLGTPYEDESEWIIRDFDRFSRWARAFSLLGNHEHSHVGGPVVPKFYPDEASVLERTLGSEADEIHAFMETFPLLAVSPSGLVLTHAAPAATEPDLDAFERLRYRGYGGMSIRSMFSADTLARLLWARSATEQQARDLLKVCALDGDPEGVVVFGHDIVRSGYEKVGREQICVSTSFGLYDRDKVYLRLDLSRRYRSVEALRPGVEIIALHG